VTNGFAVFDTQIGNDATAEVGTNYTVASTQANFTFTSNSGVLELTDPWSFNGTIYGAVTGDFVELTGATDAQVTEFASRTDPVFQIKDTSTGQTATIQFAPADIENYSTANFGVGNFLENGNLTFEVIRETACYSAGTGIATERGDIRVEELQVGDPVHGHYAGLVPIKWIGHRRINCRHHPDPEKVWPVRVRADAFGESLPRRDLWLSPDHAVYVDDVLIPIKYLMNGSTINQVPIDEITYYHIELPQHDVLLAENLPAESYLDTADRSNFDNSDCVVRLFPNFSSRCQNTCAIWETDGCAPLIVAGPKLAAVRQRVNLLAPDEIVHCGHEAAEAT
jgi:hypothetical protein